MTEIISLIFVNLVTPKNQAKLEHLFNKLSSDAPKNKLECLSVASLFNLLNLWVKPGAYLREEYLYSATLG